MHSSEFGEFIFNKYSQIFYLDKKKENAFNPIALRNAEIVYNFGLSECKRFSQEIFRNIENKRSVTKCKTYYPLIVV